MAQIKCAPVWLAGVDIALVLDTGGLGSQTGSASIEIVAPEDNAGQPRPMTPVTLWNDKAIVARVPLNAPGSHPYEIRVRTAGGQVHSARIDIRSLGGQGGWRPIQR